MARADLRSIGRYSLENFGRAQADEYLGALFRTFDIVAENPLLGQEAEGLGSGIRRYVARMHLVYYEVHAADDVVRVLHVRHGAARPAEQDDLVGD